jgi:hypothetical protein
LEKGISLLGGPVHKTDPFHYALSSTLLICPHKCGAHPFYLRMEIGKTSGILYTFRAIFRTVLPQ